MSQWATFPGFLWEADVIYLFVPPLSDSTSHTRMHYCTKHTSERKKNTHMDNHTHTHTHCKCARLCRHNYLQCVHITCVQCATETISITDISVKWCPHLPPPKSPKHTDKHLPILNCILKLASVKENLDAGRIVGIPVLRYDILITLDGYWLFFSSEPE
jgi:hypothetical protein